MDERITFKVEDWYLMDGAGMIVMQLDGNEIFELNADDLEAFLGEFNPLELSIRKWEAIVKALKKYFFVVDGGPSTCGLCAKYRVELCNSRDFDIACDGCPVKKKTGLDGCRSTPYSDYSKATETWDLISNIVPEDVRQLAKNELEFLKSLKEER